MKKLYNLFFGVLFFTLITSAAEAPVAENMSIVELPYAVPAITQEESIKANEDAMSFQRERKEKHATTKDIKEVVEESKTLPAAVPVLTSEEAKKANKEAIRFQRDKAFASAFHSFIRKIGLNSNQFCFILFLLPLLLIIDAPLKLNKRRLSDKFEKLFPLQRRFCILCTVSLLVFGLCVFVPWNVYFGNSAQFSFIFSDFFIGNIIFLVSCILGLSVILLIIPRVISDYLISLIAGLGLCVYIQSMFMNCFLGEMNGAEPEWGQHRLWGGINIAIWSVIIFTPFITKHKFKHNFLKITSMIVGVVLLLEIVAVLSMVFSSSEYVWSRNNRFFIKADKMFHYSQEKNIVIFIFDQMGGDLVNPCLEADPELNNVLKDFTWYTDARGEYSSTYPGILHELTGTHISPANDIEDLFEKTWHSSAPKSFYSQMKKIGYDCRLFFRSPQELGNPKNFHEYFSNVSEETTIEYIVDKKALHQCLVYISGFSASPYFLKRYFFYGDDFSKNVVEQRQLGSKDTDQTIPQRNDTVYTKLSSGISTVPGQPVFAIHYTRGVHPPRYVDEKCKYHEQVFKEILPTARSCFFLLSEFIRQLKLHNIYDNTCIVVFSDHESRCSEYQGPFSLITLMIKPFFANNQQIIMDDSKASSIDIIPTLLYLADKESDFSAFDGFPVSKIPSDRIRKAYWVTYLSALPPFLGVDGNPLLYNCFREFLLTEDGGYSLLRYIPYNKNVKIDDNQLINRSINK